VDADHPVCLFRLISWTQPYRPFRRARESAVDVRTPGEPRPRPRIGAQGPPGWPRAAATCSPAAGPRPVPDRQCLQLAVAAAKGAKAGCCLPRPACTRTAVEERTATMCADRRNSLCYHNFLQQLEADNPTGDIVVITDNLSSPTSVSTRQWLTGHPRIRQVFIPKNACWLTCRNPGGECSAARALPARNSPAQPTSPRDNSDHNPAQRQSQALELGTPATTQTHLPTNPDIPYLRNDALARALTANVDRLAVGHRPRRGPGRGDVRCGRPAAQERPARRGLHDRPSPVRSIHRTRPIVSTPGFECLRCP
jgi:hypothetical protein